MLFFQTTVKDSFIAGKGLFADEAIKKASIVSIDAVDVKVASEEEYKQAQRDGNEIVIRNGVRWVGSYFHYPPDDRLEGNINHSSDPNLLYHCGICFARRDIQVGEELTVNYSLFLAENDVERFKDVSTGEIVLGLPSREALVVSTRELLLLLTDES